VVTAFNPRRVVIWDFASLPQFNDDSIYRWPDCLREFGQLKEKDGDAPKMSKSQNPTKEVIPIMKKRIYRRMPVNDFQLDSISVADLGGKLVFAIDVAKVDMVAALATAEGRVLQTISWKAPDENPLVLEILRSFRSAGIPVEPVMEPSGTYGDVLRHQLEQDGFPLFMVSGKRTFDAREIFDGVPSLHDAKSAAIIARLHADNLSSRLRDEGPDRRQLRAALAIMDLHQERYLQLVHRLESWLARHWPELPTLIELTSSSLTALLARVGGPADVAAAPDKATKVLLGISHRLIPDDKVAAIVTSAKASVGVPLVGLERDALMAIADDAYRAHRAFAAAKTQVDKLAATTPAAALAPAVGQTTAAAVFAEVGDAKSYSCTRALNRCRPSRTSYWSVSSTQADCLRSSHSLNLSPRTWSFLPLPLPAERISCAH
jgi:transposase